MKIIVSVFWPFSENQSNYSKLFPFFFSNYKLITFSFLRFNSMRLLQNLLLWSVSKKKRSPKSSWYITSCVWREFCRVNSDRYSVSKLFLQSNRCCGSNYSGSNDCNLHHWTHIKIYSLFVISFVNKKWTNFYRTQTTFTERSVRDCIALNNILS